MRARAVAASEAPPGIEGVALALRLGRLREEEEDRESEQWRSERASSHWGGSRRDEIGTPVRAWLILWRRVGVVNPGGTNRRSAAASPG
jgi:hypothetical protein